MAKCKMCGAPIDMGVCKYCGTKEEINTSEGDSNAWTSVPQTDRRAFQEPDREETISEKNKLVAFLLAFFTGPFGLHNFYAGRALRGVLYIITGGFLFVGCIIDLVMIAMGKFKDGQGNYIK